MIAWVLWMHFCKIRNKKTPLFFLLTLFWSEWKVTCAGCCWKSRIGTVFYLRGCVPVFNPRSLSECSLYHTSARRYYFLNIYIKIYIFLKGYLAFCIQTTCYSGTWDKERHVWLLCRSGLSDLAFRSCRYGELDAAPKLGPWCKWSGFQP